MIKRGVALFGIGSSGVPMDVAWLWTLGQTRRKSERTFHNVIAWTNLPVENESALRLENDTIQPELKPYRIMTLRVKPQ